MNTLENSGNRTIGQIVADNYRTAAIFKKHKIDYCCKGDRKLENVCKDETELHTLLDELEKSKSTASSDETDFRSMKPAELCEYIVQKHHTYVEEAIGQIRPLLKKIVAVHGAGHPELSEIEREFTVASGELAMHMKKEELILFPYILKLQEANENQQAIAPPHFGTVAAPVRMMQEEHAVEGDRFARIRKLSNDYSVPQDGCTTYQVTYALLEEFETDLHRHIHLENNILFPLALQLEKSLTDSK